MKIKKASDWISRTGAIKLLAKATPKANDVPGSAMDRVGHRVAAAIRSKSLLLAPGDRFVLGDLVKWARSKRDLREAVAGLPVSPPDPVELSAHARTSSSAGARLSPGTLRECRAALGEALAQIRSLEVCNDELNRELALLRPIAEKRERISKVNTINGGKRRLKAQRA